MPQILSYGTSIHSSSGTWTDPTTNALGAPNGVFANSFSTSGVIRVRLAGFAALPDAAVINRVVIGMRYRPSGTTPSTRALLTGAGTVEGTVFTPAIAASLANVLHNVELERPGSGFTVSGLKNADFRLQITKASGTNNQLEVDAVWAKVTYDEPEVTSYGTTHVSSTNWTSGTSVVAPPDGVAGSTSTNAAPAVFRAAGLASLSPSSAIDRVVVGMRVRCSATGATMGIKLSSSVGTVDPVEKVYTAADTFWQLAEWDLDPTKFTVSALTDPLLTVTLTKTGGTLDGQVDAFWVRALTSLSSRAKRWTGSAWVPAVTKRWDGSAWVTAAATKRWDGSAWV